MKVKSYGKAKAMMVSLEEATALQKADQVLGGVQSSLGGENTIMSLETGEVITPGRTGKSKSNSQFCVYLSNGRNQSGLS